MRENPLWIVAIVTSVVYTNLSMSVSVEHEKVIKNPKKSFIVTMVIFSVILVAVAYLISITPNYGWIDGLLLGAILFICGFIPFYYIYRLRKKRLQDLEDE